MLGEYPTKGPMLAPNDQVDFTVPKYPALVSYKFDGSRVIVYNGKLFTRNLKLHPNQNLKLRFAALLDLSCKGWVFDGELYDPNLEFNELQSTLRSFTAPLQSSLGLFLFDSVRLLEWNSESRERFIDRIETYRAQCAYNKPPYVTAVHQQVVNDPASAQLYFNEVISNGGEGIILRDPQSRYKHGRATIKERTMFKFKISHTLDARIVEITQGRKLRVGVERTRRLDGSLERPFKNEDYTLDNCMGAFVVEHEGKTFKVGTGKGLDRQMKEFIWQLKNQYIGRWIEFKYLPVGNKDVPRMGKFVRFRTDLDNG